jgi:ligand-binding sensor domain-containing protein
MSRRGLLLLALCCALESRAAANPAAAHGLDDFTVRTWNENDGLSVSRITAISQDHDGYLWLGTDAGLVRFDGVRFVPVSEVGGVALQVAPIPALHSSSDHSLWIGTSGPSGLARLKNGRLTQYGPSQGLLAGYVVALIEDHAGVLWAGNASGLSTFDGEQWHAVHDPALAQSAVLALHESRDGSIWVATRTSVYRRRAGESGFALVDTFEIASNAWQGFSEDADGVVWISDFREGFRRVGATPSPAAAHRGWGVKLLHDRRGNFWVATRGQGLWRVRPDAHGAQGVEFLTRHHGLATDAVHCVFEDREGNVWVGTQAGLQRLTPHRVTPITDVPLARAMALTADGSVWVGSTSGLTRFSAPGRQRYGEAEGLPGSVVLALHVDHDGVLWVATERGIVSFVHGVFSPLVVPPNRPNQRFLSLVHAQSAFWLRDITLSLMKVSDQGQAMPLAEIPEEFRRGVMTLADDPQGNLWLGGTDGRLGALRRDGRFARYELGIGGITAILPAADGAVWVGGDNGLSVVEHDRVRTITGAHGLPTRVKSIAEDREGVLWVGFGSGIARLEKSEIARALAERTYRIQYRLFNTADGAAGVPMTDGSRAAVVAPDNRLWFATSAGVTVIDPARIGAPRPRAPAILEALTTSARTI